jgi:hypothetical protein
MFMPLQRVIKNRIMLFPNARIVTINSQSDENYKI